MAKVDNSAWDANQAWANGAASDDPAAFYNGICAGKRDGDPSTQEAHALPHHYHPGDPPNAAGVRNALARFDQTEGLTNKAEARQHLEAHMKAIQAAEGKSLTPDEIRTGRAALYANSDVHKRELPCGAARLRGFPSELRAKLVHRNGHDFYEVEGYATVFNKPYAMYDLFGEYEEIAEPGMLDKSLALSPDVAFLVNHRGITMARTTNGTLDLSKDSTGLAVHAYLNAERQDVRDLASAIRDQLVDEMSFAFMLNEGWWNDDFTLFKITEADINRGDVSAVNYGANPYTSIAARSQEFMQLARSMPAHLVPPLLAELERVHGSLDSVRNVTVGSVTKVFNPVNRAALETTERETQTPVETRAAGNTEGDDFARARIALLALDSE